MDNTGAKLEGKESINKKKILLEVKNLKMYFPIKEGLLKRITGYVKAVDDVNFDIFENETFGIVGESGCGKTTLAKCIMSIYNSVQGKIIYHQENGKKVNLNELSSEEIKKYRREIRMIFQDPQSSLNPRLPVLDIIGEPLKVHKIARGEKLKERVASLMRRVGLRPEYMRRYPNAFSGGQRQRIGVARALALNPRLVVCDEPVSALDVSVQAQTINLLNELQDEFGLTYIFIAHDLSVVEHISDRVAVMYVGKFMETAAKEKLFRAPLHPYTEALLSTVPIPDPRMRDKRDRIRLEGEVADPSNPPTGCYFNPRCSYSKQVCQQDRPELREVKPDHYVACHFADELNLSGVTE